MSISVLTPAPAKHSESKIDLIPPAAGIAAGTAVATMATNLGLAKALTALTAAAIVWSGFSYYPAIASGVLAASGMIMGVPLVRATFAVAAAAATWWGGKLLLKFGRAGVDIAKRTSSIVKTAVSSIPRWSPVPAVRQERYAPA
jgi:hypothetical protein